MMSPVVTHDVCFVVVVMTPPLNPRSFRPLDPEALRGSAAVRPPQPLGPQAGRPDRDPSGEGAQLSRTAEVRGHGSDKNLQEEVLLYLLLLLIPIFISGVLQTVPPVPEDQ